MDRPDPILNGVSTGDADKGALRLNAAMKAFPLIQSV